MAVVLYARLKWKARIKSKINYEIYDSPRIVCWSFTDLILLRTIFGALQTKNVNYRRCKKNELQAFLGGVLIMHKSRLVMVYLASGVESSSWSGVVFGRSRKKHEMSWTALGERWGALTALNSTRLFPIGSGVITNQSSSQNKPQYPDRFLQSIVSHVSLTSVNNHL